MTNLRTVPLAASLLIMRTKCADLLCSALGRVWIYHTLDDTGCIFSNILKKHTSHKCGPMSANDVKYWLEEGWIAGPYTSIHKISSPIWGFQNIFANQSLDSLRFIQFPDPSFNHRIWNLKSQRMSAKYGVWLVSWLALWKQLWEWPSRQRIHSGGWDRVHMWRYMPVIFSSKIGWLVSEMWFKPLSPYDTWHFKKQQTDASVSGFFRSDIARVLVRPVSFEVPGSKRQSSSVPDESNSGHSAHRPWVRWYWALDKLCHEYLHGYAMVVNVSRHRSFMILIRGLGFPSYLPEAAPAPTA